MAKFPIVLTSTSTFLNPDKIINHEKLRNLTEISENGFEIYIVSNNPIKPEIELELKKYAIKSISWQGRQKGDKLKEYILKKKLKPYNVIILASNKEDLIMGKNSNSFIISTAWGNSNNYGITVKNLVEFKYLLNIVRNWSGEWWYKANYNNDFKIYALSDLSSKYKPESQEKFSDLVTKIVKNGRSFGYINLNAILAFASISIFNLETDLENPLFGVYPSSNSSNKDEEILSDFTHRLRW